MLMDEPLSNLDAKLRLEMRAEVRRIHQTMGATTIYVTHDQEEALALADRIVLLRDGMVRQVGTPAALYDEPDHLDVAEFMGFRNRVSGRVVTVQDGRVTVMVGGTPIEGRPRAHLKPGDAASLVVRPNDLAAGTAGLMATVRSAEFQGHGFTGFAQTPDGTELVFTAPDAVMPGASVQLQADPARVLVFPT